MRKLGQHFLKNRTVIEKIVRAADPQANETVIEIGPGHGELTRGLVARKKKTTKIIAIEKDHGLVAHLVTQEELKNVELIHGDALEIIPALAKSYRSKVISYSFRHESFYLLTRKNSLRRQHSLGDPSCRVR